MKIKKSLIGACMSSVALLLAACGGTSDPLGEASPQPNGSPSAAVGEVVVGSADFTESKIFAEI